METVLVPLSDYESNRKDNTAVTLGYQFPLSSAPERDELEVAIKRGMERVVDKWRLLAGRMKWCPDLGRAGRWSVVVPTGDIPATYKTHNFSSTTQNTPIPLKSSLDPLFDDSATLLKRPAPSYFRNFDEPAANAPCLEKNAPILNVKITKWSDCLCLGISVPHGVFDGTGMGMFIRFLNCEINNLPWTAPPLSTSSNPLSNALSSLPALDGKEAAKLPVVMRDYSPFSVLSALRFLLRFWVEKYWYKVTMRGVFLGKRVVDGMMEGVRKDLSEREDEKEWVSEGDVMVAWTLKTAYNSKPARQATLHISPVFSIRSLLSNATNSLSLYPHNANISFPFPLLPISTLCKLPLATLAMLHRRSLLAARKVEYIKKSLDWVAERGGAWVPDRRWGKDSWIVTNQSSGGLTELYWKGKQVGRFWIWFFPITPSHGLSINKLNGGYLMMSTLRPEQWSSIEQELKRIREGSQREID